MLTIDFSFMLSTTVLTSFKDLQLPRTSRNSVWTKSLQNTLKQIGIQFSAVWLCTNTNPNDTEQLYTYKWWNNLKRWPLTQDKGHGYCSTRSRYSVANSQVVTSLPSNIAGLCKFPSEMAQACYNYTLKLSHTLNVISRDKTCSSKWFLVYSFGWL